MKLVKDTNTEQESKKISDKEAEEAFKIYYDKISKNLNNISILK